ncbi:MAG: PRTRC system protein C [Chloroflexi bacterium]|nr:PRTRC system protein C [Chloroflexota bacterium]
MVKKRDDRNVVTLSHLDRDLERWTESEARRRRSLGLPYSSKYEVIAYALAMLRERSRPGKWLYYVAGRGPYLSVEECLDAMGIPQKERGKYWHRWDRLPRRYSERIERFPNRLFVYDGREHSDPDPRLTPDEVRQQMQAYYPELEQAIVTETVRRNTIIYTFEKGTGSKGCDAFIELLFPGGEHLLMGSGSAGRVLEPVAL